MSLLNSFLLAFDELPGGASDLTEAVKEAIPAVAMGPSSMVLLLGIFIMAVFIGVEIITKIPPTLHTPLMSGSNAISGITLVGALLSAGAGGDLLPKILGFVAVVLATINVVGGFMVTHRMLGMFRKKG
jgi:H+-translocating NAD(P) transhydrogenase subunit alpha